MENIKLEIKSSDIQEYLKDLKKNHPEEYKNFYQYKEAMFVKYMKESKEITKESLEILMKKYNFDDISIAGTYDYDSYGILKRQTLNCFNAYLDGINNLDISGICHIMIPCIKYYDHSDFRHCIYSNRLDDIAEKLGIIQYDKQDEILLDSIDNYTIAGQIEDFKNTYRGYSRITMSKYKSKKLIQQYSSIYGEEPVKQIRKIIRERV